MGRLQGKVAIITGGGQGVGFGIAQVFGAEGSHIVITGRTAQTLEKAAAQLRDRGIDTLTVVGDAGKRSDADRAVAETVARFGRVDILVNNAQSFSSGVMLEDLTEEQLNLNIRSGVYGSFYFMRAVLPHMKAQGGGKIINLGSRNGIEGPPGFGAYAAAKEGIRGMSRVAAREWGQYNIQVNVINPAALSATAEEYLATHPEHAAKVMSQIALGRLGDCEKDIGRAALFLASADSDYVTGQTINVDGGQVML